MTFEMSLETATTMTMVCAAFLFYLSFMLATERKKPNPDIVFIGLVLIVLSIIGTGKIHAGVNADHYKLWQGTLLVVSSWLSIFLFWACVWYYITGGLKTRTKKLIAILRLSIKKSLQLN